MAYVLAHQKRLDLLTGNLDVTVKTQMWVTDQLWEGLKHNPQEELSSRPLLVYWFMGHITRYVPLSCLLQIVLTCTRLVQSAHPVQV